jgi:RimJ/RimL family protein N-acetyltransferase
MAELAFPTPPLTDGIVALRPFSFDDASFVTDACRDPEISRYSPHFPRPFVREDAVAWLATHEPSRRAGRNLELAISDAQTGALLGAVSLIRVDRMLQTAHVGYWLAGEARGHGYVTRAVRLLAAWAFDQLALVRLTLTTDPENLASRAVAERCGFTCEGLMRSHTLIRHSGQRRDTLVYGLLADEFA